MKPFFSLKLISHLVLFGSLASIPGCYCQRSITSLGSKLETPNLASKKKKPFFGAAAAELLVDNEAESSDGELAFFEEKD